MAISACATTQRKAVIEGGSQGGQPSWVNSTKITWEDAGQVFFRTQYTIRGDERVNGCYQLAKLEGKETLLREISEELRGQIDNAQQSISENAEIILNQSRASEFGGRVTGLRYLEQYHERYKVEGTERVDCYLLGSIKKIDYENIRRAVVYKLAEVDPGLRQAINKRQINFFEQAPGTQPVVTAPATPVAHAVPKELPPKSIAAPTEPKVADGDLQ
ncbi:MAG: hypothetical protein HC883_02860 [Bdellovibrionaceae bacterium]|nr:hypothetical protein [Pseudobdellovibrionaceae bacterium]